MSTNAQLILVVVAIILAASLLYVGDADYREALMSEAIYNQNVCDGVWPDYNNMQPDCE
tara:strand:- start:5394 stop:5570 length:177 start_codon:yes stop_codon:yes gene_type:complete